MNIKLINKIIFLLIIPILLIEAFEGHIWYDENGNKTDLINYNPDPNGEPWLGGGLKPESSEQRKLLDKLPEIASRNYRQSGDLPDEVILLDNKEFPPVFNQVGGSCAQASGVAYTYSYQLNVLRDVEGTDENTRAYGYTHNYLNDGTNSKGSWYWDGWEILSKHGAPDVETFHGLANGGLNGTRWINGADRWHKANSNKALKYEKISINSLADIEKIKSWIYDLNGTDPQKKGGCVVFAANSASASPNGTVTGGDHAGDALSTGLKGLVMDHAMTFAGYSDNVEGGSLLLLNSWGKSWATNGYTWVPYSTVVNGGLYKNEVWCVTVVEHEPKYEIKAKITGSVRNKLIINTGFSNDNTILPESIKTYGMAFSNSGGAYPMEGMTGSNTIEVSLDISEYFDSIVDNESTFFIQLIGNGASASISDVFLVDYTGVEISEYEGVDGSVNSGDTLNIPINYKIETKRYLMNAGVIGNGEVSAEGTKMIDSGATYTYEFTPDIWHKIDSVIIDGDNVGGLSQYTFTNISSNHTITAYFSWDPNTPNLYTFSIENSQYGSITPGFDIKVEEGSDTVFNIVPEEWHTVDSVLVDGINRGPLVFAEFVHVMDNHKIETFFSEDGYPGEYEKWRSSKSYAQNKIVRHVGHLWKAKWWANAGDEPGVKEMWQDLGEEIIEQTDTLHIAFMEYRSNDIKQDTIIITTLSIFKGDTVKVVDTTVDGAVPNVKMQSLINDMKILPGAKQVLLPYKGVFNLHIYDLRGRTIRSISLLSEGRALVNVPLDFRELSSGMYLVELVFKGDKNNRVIEQIIKR